MMKSYAEQCRYLQELAGRLRDLSAAPENAEKRRRWADHNDLKARQKPLLWVCPDDDGGWLELVPPKSLQCEDPELRALENRLFKYLYQAEYLPDDFVFEPCVYFDMPGNYTGYLYGNTEQKTAWGVPIKKPKVGQGAYHLDAFIKEEKDFEPLLSHEIGFTVDEEELQRLRLKYEEALNGVIAVRFLLPYSVLVQSLLIEFVHLRGLENLMYDLYDNPELLMHAIRHMAESKARLLQKLERQKLLFDNRINIYTGSGSLGYTNAPIKRDEDVTLSDMWGFADAQEFSGVSSAMFEKYALENQKIGLQLFGSGCYGCCEPLDGKYDAIFHHLKNIRRLSVSPWSNVREAAERIGTKAIYSWKPNPAEICTGFDEESMLHKLKHVAACTRDCFVEIILKDIRTCGHTPYHLQRFIHLANIAFERI